MSNFIFSQDSNIRLSRYKFNLIIGENIGIYCINLETKLIEYVG